MHFYGLNYFNLSHPNPQTESTKLLRKLAVIMTLEIKGNNLNHVIKQSKSFFLFCLIITVTCNFLITAAFAAPAKKAEKWYEVEVIVFANNDKSLQESEEWPEKPGIPPIRNVLELFTPGELLFDDVENLPMYYVEPSDPGEDNLSALANKINAAKEYTLLMHRSWRQTVSRKKTGFPVYLDDNLSASLYQEITDETEIEEETGEVSPEQLLLEALLAEENNLQQVTNEAPFFIHELDPIVPFDETEGLPTSSFVELSPMGPPNHSLFGTLKLFKNRFLHIAVDFLYKTEPYEPVVEEIPLEEVFPMARVDSDESTNAPLTSKPEMIKSEEMLDFAQQEKPPITGFRLKGSKRIRLKEVHYFDHPLFGVIVRTIPYVQPEPEELLDAEEVTKTDGSRFR